MTTRERDAWAFAYRLYDELAPQMRQAAALDDDNETACKIFQAALSRINPHFAAPGDAANLIYIRVYDLLDDVFKEARKRHLEAVQDERRAI